MIVILEGPRALGGLIESSERSERGGKCNLALLGLDPIASLQDDKARVTKYFRVWYRLAQNNAYVTFFSAPLNSVFFLGGKLIRLGIFIVFIIYLFEGTPNILGYDKNQLLLFLLTLALVDSLGQLFLRGMYLIQDFVRSGNLDYFLTQPVNALFRIASALPDPLDFLMLFPVFWILSSLIGNIGSSVGSLLLYGLLCLNGILIVVATHIFVAALAIGSTEPRNFIWVYRDLMTMGRYPVDFYAEPVRIFLTFIIPIAVITTFPAKALLGLLSWQWVGYAFLLSWFLLLVSYKFWLFSLRHYSSASS